MRAVKRTLLVMLLFVMLGASFALLLPVGEAPDEPAHFEYIRHVARERHLPPVGRFEGLSYEGHQPPLDYLLSAVVLRALGGDDAVTFGVDPTFDARQAGSRFFTVESSPRAARTYRLLRLFHLFWGVSTLLIALLLVRRFAGDEPAPAAVAYLFAPQFLFISAVLSNDGALIAFSSATLLVLLRFIERPTARLAAAAALLATLALFSKGSALFLLAPILFATALAMRRGVWRPALLLVASTAAGIAAWGWMNIARGGSFMPHVPSTGEAGGSILSLAARPGWIVTIFRSFWAKFGAMNTALPLPFYAWFAFLTLLAAAGVVIAWKRREMREATSLLITACAGNLLLVLAFMLRVDWQPQGRYLLPSLAPLAAFGALAVGRLPERWRKLALVVLPAFSVAVAAYAAFFIAAVYGS
jgi:hypothetical protein